MYALDMLEMLLIINVVSGGAAPPATQANVKHYQNRAPFFDL